MDPLVVLVDQDRDRIIVCPLRDRRATRLLQFLLQSDLSEVLLDQETAAKVSVAGVKVDPLVRVELATRACRADRTGQLRVGV